MSYTSLNTALAKAFTAVALVGTMTGCATVCDRKCQLEETVRTLAHSSDVGIRAAAMLTLENRHPEIKEAGDDVRNLAVRNKMECTLVEQKVEGGKKHLYFNGCNNVTPQMIP